MHTGKIIQVSGPVVDVQFARGQMPKLREALTVDTTGGQRVMEAAQLMEDNIVRCIMLSKSEGLRRGMEVTATGDCIQVPVGDPTIGRMFNVLGETMAGR